MNCETVWYAKAHSTPPVLDAQMWNKIREKYPSTPGIPINSPYLRSPCWTLKNLPKLGKCMLAYWNRPLLEECMPGSHSPVLSWVGGGHSVHVAHGERNRTSDVCTLLIPDSAGTTLLHYKGPISDISVLQICDVIPPRIGNNIRCDGEKRKKINK